jgi:hypothetical protein
MAKRKQASAQVLDLSGLTELDVGFLKGIVAGIREKKRERKALEDWQGLPQEDRFKVCGVLRGQLPMELPHFSGRDPWAPFVLAALLLEELGS